MFLPGLDAGAHEDYHYQIRAIIDQEGEGPNELPTLEENCNRIGIVVKMLWNCKVEAVNSLQFGA